MPRRPGPPLLRSLLPLLVLALVLGHACDAPAFAPLAPSSQAGGDHGHAEAHHTHGPGPGEPRIVCQAVDALSSTGLAPVGAGPALAAAPLPTPRDPLRPVSSPREALERRPDRPPLFLLHASLLI